jgi:hypothetical protein
MSLSGKGFFIWKLANCENGQPDRIAQRAADAGLDHVLIKIADGVTAFGDPGLNRAVVTALHDRNIRVWGWHYIYGKQPADEARLAVSQVHAFGLDGFCLDAEAEFTQMGKDSAARTFMTELRGGLPRLPIAVSSYRYPSLHQIPWSIFLERCDYNMPQVYWEKSHNPDEQLDRSTKELLALDPPRAVFPTGSAYGAAGWEATPADLRHFLKAARNIGLTGANFYSWDYAGSSSRTAMWNAVANFDWPPAANTADTGDTPPEEPRDDSLVHAFFDALNAFDLDAVLALYQDNAAHVTARRTIVGKDALRAWYQELIDTTLKRGAFTLGIIAGGRAYRRFTWAADSFTGHVEDGDDTIGLRDGLIQYHYTYFTVLPL